MLASDDDDDDDGDGVKRCQDFRWTELMFHTCVVKWD